jgi:hypothetical protein
LFAVIERRECGSHLHQRGSPPFCPWSKHAVTWDPLLVDDWPAQWSPFSVVIRARTDTIELIAEGHLDAWAVGALVRNLAAVFEPSFKYVHLNLRKVTGGAESIEAGLSRCRDYVSARGATLRVTPAANGLLDDPL